MDKKELKEEVKAIVDELLKDKEEAEFTDKLESTLTEYKTQIADITQQVSDKDAEIVGLKSQLEEKSARLTSLEEEVTQLKSTVEALTSEKESISTEKSELEQKLLNIEKDNVAKERVNQLIEASLIKNEQEVIEKYLARVRDKSDDEFAGYLAELTEIRDSVVSSLKVEPEKEEAVEKKEEPVKDPLQAALNFEIQPPEELTKKYQEMASNLVTK